MKPRTLGLILEVCLIGIVLDLPVFFFSMILGASIMIILVAVLLFSGWKVVELLRTDPDAFKALPEGEKELTLKDLPRRLVILLVVAFVVSLLASLNVFSFNPFIDTVVAALVLLLVVYYFFQKRKLRKKV